MSYVGFMRTCSTPTVGAQHVARVALAGDVGRALPVFSAYQGATVWPPAVPARHFNRLVVLSLAAARAHWLRGLALERTHQGERKAIFLRRSVH